MPSKDFEHLANSTPKKQKLTTRLLAAFRVRSSHELFPADSKTLNLIPSLTALLRSVHGIQASLQRVFLSQYQFFL